MRQAERGPSPNDPQAPEFWNALRQAQGLQTSAGADGTVKATGTEFIAHCKAVSPTAISPPQRSLSTKR